MDDTVRKTRENVCDLYCIGAQKAGTSWLHHVVNVHPRIHIFPNSAPVTSTNKEAHFWDWNRNRGVDWYRRLMQPKSDDQIVIDFTPEYSLLKPDHIKECFDLSPKAKIIYVLRDPVERAISALRMFYLWEKEFTHIPLDNFFIHLWKVKRIRDNSRYIKNYERWANVYGKENILVLAYASIAKEPMAVIDKVYTHVGLKRSDHGFNHQQLEERVRKQVWKSERFPVDDHVRFFLKEALDGQKSAAESYFNLDLTEA